MDMFNLTEKRLSFEKMRKNYCELERTMASTFSVLSSVGFRRKKGEKKYTSGEYDIQHTICATYCDIFISADSKFIDKYRAVAYYLGIPIDMKLFKEKSILDLV